MRIMPDRFPHVDGSNWIAFLNAAAYRRPDPVFYRHNEVMDLFTPAIHAILSE